MPYVSGFLIEGPVDPGFGHRPGGGGEHPDQGLPGGPVHPWIPGHLPSPPPVWPPLTPSHPIQPAPPGTPPGVIWPPVYRPVDPGFGHPEVGPGHPSTGPVPTPPGGPPMRPDQGLPAGGAHPDQGLPSQTYWVVVGIPGVGWRYVAIDPSLDAGMPLPPTAAPKA